MFGVGSMGVHLEKDTQKGGYSVVLEVDDTFVIPDSRNLFVSYVG